MELGIGVETLSEKIKDLCIKTLLEHILLQK